MSFDILKKPGKSATVPSKDVFARLDGDEVTHYVNLYRRYIAADFESGAGKLPVVTLPMRDKHLAEANVKWGPDRFEVASVEVWPIWEFQKSPKSSDAKAIIKAKMDAYEYSVYQRVLRKSRFKAVLNEKDMVRCKAVQLPESKRGLIIPKEIFEERVHPDVRIARRASTIAALTRVISERDVSDGLRRTLLIQARRLEELSSRRFEQVMTAVATAGSAANDDEVDFPRPGGTGIKPAQRVGRRKRKKAS